MAEPLPPDMTGDSPAPVKIRIEPLPNQVVVQDQTGTETEVLPAEVKVLAEKPGAVNWLDKAKAYYHTIITLIGALVVMLNELTPLSNFMDDTTQRIFSIAVVFFTAALNFLKSNEVWVNKL
ncbi:membrane protein [Mycobacterium phage Rope]|uniref:Membrane protein n=1 Tax=Mycobacterium phage Rope TaxID=2767563 RepID=A0A7G9V091_9CAUD|nr:membrane protein [Mycobacterium phage Rope]